MFKKILSLFGINTANTNDFSTNGKKLFVEKIPFAIDKIEVKNSVWYIFINAIEESPISINFKDLQINSEELISYLQENSSIDKAKLFEITPGDKLIISLSMRTYIPDKKATIYAPPRYITFTE